MTTAKIPIAQASAHPARFRLPFAGRITQPWREVTIGAVCLGIVVAALVLAPVLTKQDPTAQNLQAAFAPRSAAHPLGTDQFGRDIFSRLLYGGRVDLSVAIIAVAVPLLLGTILGAVAGYFGGAVDTIIMRFADLVSAFPFFVLVIVLVFVLGNGATSIFISISAVSWVPYARIARGETLTLRDRDFIASCRASGLSSSWVLSRHVIPNVASQGIVYAMSDIVLNIGVIVTLAYFGLGIVPPTPDWGQMMNDGQQFLSAGMYSLTLVPASVVVFISLALSFLGDGLAKILKVQR